jgi:hypothetical protein
MRVISLALLSSANCNKNKLFKLLNQENQILKSSQFCQQYIKNSRKSMEAASVISRRGDKDYQ